MSPDEWNRLGSVLTEQDFNTYHPPSGRIEKIAQELDRYRKYKVKHSGEWGERL